MSVRTFLAVVALAPALLLPAVTHADPLYTVSLLPDGLFPYAINNAGQIAGYTVANGNAHAALYANGVLTDLGSFGGTTSYARDINDAGTLTGNFTSTLGESHGFIYKNGSMTDLGANTDAFGINAQGDVAGSISVGQGLWRGLVYKNGNLTVLGALGTGTVSLATDINDAGTVVGASNVSAEFHSPFQPVRYTSATGAANDLGSLANFEVNSAEAINNAGQIAGYSEAQDGSLHAFLYENATMTDLGSFNGLFLSVGGINESGAFVGGASSPGDDIGYIYRDGVLQDLSTLLDPALGWHISDASGINDAGQIVAYGCRDFVCSSVLLSLTNPVPEPAGPLLLLAGLLTLGGLRWRQAAQVGRAVARRLHIGGTMGMTAG